MVTAKSKKFFSIENPEIFSDKIKGDAFSICPAFLQKNELIQLYRSYWFQKIKIYERFLKKGDLVTRLKFESVGYYDVFIWGPKLNNLEILNEVMNQPERKFKANFGKRLEFEAKYAGYDTFFSGLGELHRTVKLNPYSNLGKEKIKVIKLSLIFFFKVQ